MSDQSNYFHHLKKILEKSTGRVLLSSVSIYSSSAKLMEKIFPLHGISSQLKEKLVGAVKAFMEIVYKTKPNSIQLNSLVKFNHVIVGGNNNTSFADKGLL